MISFRPLRADEVECRVGQCSKKGTGCSLLLYKTARTDMALLDESVGPENWQCDYKTIEGKLFCGIGVRDSDGRWVWKWDTGTESNMDPQKGEASDAFKRAGFKWGIGRELYETPFIWIPSDKCGIEKRQNGTYACFDRFEVSKMEVDDGSVTVLEIRNMSRKGEVVFSTSSKTAKSSTKAQENAPEKKDDAIAIAKRRMWTALQRYAELHGRTPEDILKGVQKRPEWTETADFFNMVASEFEAECHV